MNLLTPVRKLFHGVDHGIEKELGVKGGSKTWWQVPRMKGQQQQQDIEQGIFGRARSKHQRQVV